MDSKKEILKLISDYSELYQKFEKFQTKKTKDVQGILPIGDQKTGVIGEYYAKCYIESLPNVIEVKYANPGDPFDLIYILKDSAKEIKVQVKCVSAHSKTRTIAPLNLAKSKDGKDPFDFLYLISLNKEFLPNGFYINSFDRIISIIGRNRGKIYGLKMKTDNNPGSDRVLDFSKDKSTILNNILSE